MRVAVLGSGSRGNAVVVDAGPGGGSCSTPASPVARSRSGSRALGIAAESLEAILVTHEHRDHVRGADRWRGAGGCRSTPPAAPSPTRAGCRSRRAAAGAADRLRRAARGGGFVVEPFAIPHDAAEPVGMVLTAPDGCRLGLAGDLGSRSRLAWARLAELDVLLLETNHDLDMLRNGPYPWVLKQRIASSHGHLSNRDAADGLPELLCDRLRWVVCYHLSQTNNMPQLAAEEVAMVLAREGSRAAVAVGDQDRPGEWIEVTASGQPAAAPGAVPAADQLTVPLFGPGSLDPAAGVSPSRGLRRLVRRLPRRPREPAPNAQLGLAFGGEG
jgi:phosphoribosyl 1,2-cyclic phosphodiesterase